MSKPKLGSKTPDSSDSNSLIETHDQMIDDPRARRYAVIEIGVTDIITKIATGDVTAVFNLLHIEEMTGGSLNSALALMDAVYIARTGNKVRPGPGEQDTPLDLSGLPNLDNDEDRAAWESGAGVSQFSDHQKKS